MEDFLRVAVAALALCAALVLFARPGGRTTIALAAFVVMGLGAFAIASTRGGPDALGIVVFAADAWCLATPAVLALLAFALFVDGFVLKPWHLLAAGMFAAASFAASWGHLGVGLLGGDAVLAATAHRGMRLAALFAVAAAIAAAVSSWRDDLVEPRRQARAVFIAGVGMVSLMLIASDLLLGSSGAPAGARTAGLAAIAMFVLATAFAAAGGHLDALFHNQVNGDGYARTAPALALVEPGTPQGAPVWRAAAVEAALARRVVARMQEERLWRREGLGIATLASELGTQEHLLRRAINRHLGYRNFNDFLHDWRLKEVAARLADAEDHALPVLTIALEAGYGSIGPFNRAFKARFGVTPTQYRNLQAGAGPAEFAENRAESEISHAGKGDRQA